MTTIEKSTTQAVEKMTNIVGTLIQCMTSFKDVPESLNQIEDVLTHKDLLTKWITFGVNLVESEARDINVDVNANIKSESNPEPNTKPNVIDDVQENIKDVNDVKDVKDVNDVKDVKDVKANKLAKNTKEKDDAKAIKLAEKTKEKAKEKEEKAKEKEEKANEKAKEKEKIKANKLVEKSLKPRGRPKKNQQNVVENTNNIERMILSNVDTIEIDYEMFDEIIIDQILYLVFNGKSNNTFNYGDAFSADFEKFGELKCGEYDFNTKKMILC